MAHAAQDRLWSGVQADDQAISHHQGTIFWIDQCAAAGGDHQVVSHTQLFAEHTFHLAESSLATLGEDARDRFPGPRFDLGVHIHKGAAQPPRHFASHGRLSSAHEAG